MGTSKTAEEILRNKFEPAYFTIREFDNIVSAMKEYASQLQPTPTEEVKEKLTEVEFKQWYMNEMPWFQMGGSTHEQDAEKIWQFLSGKQS